MREQKNMCAHVNENRNEYFIFIESPKASEMSHELMNHDVLSNVKKYVHEIATRTNPTSPGHGVNYEKYNKNIRRENI